MHGAWMPDTTPEHWPLPPHAAAAGGGDEPPGLSLDQLRDLCRLRASIRRNGYLAMETDRTWRDSDDGCAPCAAPRRPAPRPPSLNAYATA